MREVAQMGSSSVAPIIIVIAVVLVGLFTASWFRRIERQLKETRKILGELERRLDVVRCRYRDERDQDMQRLKAV
jgi:uncharacterized protein YoxC